MTACLIRNKPLPITGITRLSRAPEAGVEGPPAGAFGLTFQELFILAIAVNVVIGVILALIGYRRRLSYARAGHR